MGGVKSQGTKFGVSTLPATVYTPVQCNVSIDKQDVEATTIDVTCLISTAKEKLIGLQDNGTIALGLNVNFGDAGYIILEAAKASGDTIGFQIELPPQTGFTVGYIFTGECLVKALPYNISVDQAITGTANLEVTGEIVKTEPVLVPV